ncbi:MAG: universal stress protein [Acidimicrobiia bacterium]
MPKTIVVPLDGSSRAEGAVRVAAPLAQALGADVVLVATPWTGDPRAPRAYLEGVAAETPQVPLQTMVVEADAADAIRQTADERPAAMVCMTTHGRGRLRWAVAGSVAEEVIRASTGPLMLVGPRGEPSWSRPARRLVVCVDGTDAARIATHHACEWAKALDLEVHIVLATHPLDVASTEHPEVVFAPYEQIVAAEGLQVNSHQLFRSSFLGGALADFAEEPPATLMVMAAHAHTGIGRVVLGSTTMAVLNVASCPVLVIPPGES